MAIVVMTNNDTLKAGIDSIISGLPIQNKHSTRNYYIVDSHSLTFNANTISLNDYVILFYENQSDLNVLHYLYESCQIFFISLKQKVNEIKNIIKQILSAGGKPSIDNSPQSICKN
ncbi:hypothetical protein DES37_104172 [Mangrovibacter plantisponsor]|uniref:Uncharacterized protein n=1 Tax=Mangrovibacter plantisponsor TaxID=451513 RepID=A0A317Q265_9ENTR|nr:hypothetical protein DES37_104172 [Mangrovibacter plantisponsor]